MGLSNVDMIGRRSWKLARVQPYRQSYSLSLFLALFECRKNRDDQPGVSFSRAGYGATTTVACLLEKLPPSEPQISEIDDIIPDNSYREKKVFHFLFGEIN